MITMCEELDLSFILQEKQTKKLVLQSKLQEGMKLANSENTNQASTLLEEMLNFNQGSTYLCDIVELEEFQELQRIKEEKLVYLAECKYIEHVYTKYNFQEKIWKYKIKPSYIPLTVFTFLA